MNTFHDSLDDVSAQDVIDALRLALLAQQDPVEVTRIVNGLVDFAPDTASNGGIDLLLRLIAEGTLKVALTDV